MSDIPNTESGTVATLAIAWEIVKVAYNVNGGAVTETKEAGQKELTNAVIKTFVAIQSCKPIE